jgi:GxxExxY protein
MAFPLAKRATLAKEAAMDENEIGKLVVDVAIAVHRQLGPGLLESVYEAVMMRQLQTRGLHVERQVSIPILFDGVVYDEGFRADLLVERKVILELKSVEAVHDVHHKQLLTYLKLTGLKLGFLINFRNALMKEGLTRIVNGLDERK